MRDGNPSDANEPTKSWFCSKSPFKIPNRTFPLSLFAAISKAGFIFLEGPHQGAENITNQGSELSSTVEKLELSRVATVLLSAASTSSLLFSPEARPGLPLPRGERDLSISLLGDECLQLGERASAFLSSLPLGERAPPFLSSFPFGERNLPFTSSLQFGEAALWSLVGGFLQFGESCLCFGEVPLQFGDFVLGLLVCCSATSFSGATSSQVTTTT